MFALLCSRKWENSNEKERLGFCPLGAYIFVEENKEVAFKYIDTIILDKQIEVHKLRRK